MRNNARPQITACYNTGNVQGYDNYVGGVSGTNQGIITASFNTGGVTGRSYVGGVAGLNTAIHWDADPAKNPSDVTQREGWYIAEITACYNTGSITGSITGGISGQNNHQAYKLVEGNGAWMVPESNPEPFTDPQYYEGQVVDGRWRKSLNGPSNGISHIEGNGIPGVISMTLTQDGNTGCAEFTGDPNPGNWYSNQEWRTTVSPSDGYYWKSLGAAPKLYWE
jgi:hypothetical protein